MAPKLNGSYLASIATVAAILLPTLAVGGWVTRTEIHIVDFDEFEQNQCRRNRLSDCEEICKRNGIPWETCDCIHCDKVCGR